MYTFSNKHNKFITENLIENEYFLNIRFPDIPASGWKIHVSCIKSNYNSILDIVSEYCVEKKLSFKVIKDIDLYFKNGLKTGDRSSYGKFITIYPINESQFIEVIEELYLQLKNFEGPYILSDKRYKECRCLYYRYGNNILNNTYDSKGEAIRIVEYKNHEYVDIPNGYYDVPDFIKEPFDFDDSHDTSSKLLVKYEIDTGISFTPIGGVYKAKQRKNNIDCIVKEFYPHTGILDEKNDSFLQYRSEVENLKKLQKFQFIPKFIESFQDWENFYLIEEYIEGDSFESYIAKYNTVILGLDSRSAKSYTVKILKLFLKIIDNIIELYQEGYILTDLAPDNIIINQGMVYFIDLESVHDIGVEKKVFSYTLNFYDTQKNDEENIKLLISNLLLFCFNRKSSLFNIFNAEQILEPIIRRYPEISKILELINMINDPEIRIVDIKDLFLETIEKINSSLERSHIEFCKINSELKNNLNLSITPEVLKCDGFIDNPIENKNSISYGTLGQFLANNYIFNRKFKKKDFKNYILDYRTNSFFYGYSGLLYILNLNSIKCNEVLLKVISNIDFDDKSLQTGISGIGISLLYDYSMHPVAKTKKIIVDIKEELNKTNIELYNNSLESGKLGIALFYIYYYYIFKEEESMSKAMEYLDNVISDFQSDRYKKQVAEDSGSNIYEYYLANGLCGLIVVLTEFSVKTNNFIYINKIEYFVKLCCGVYSISPSFFTGNAGLLYTFFKVYKNIDLNESFEKMIIEQIEQFYLDILNVNLDNKFYDANSSNHEKNFFGGKEGILTIINMVNKNEGEGKVFPFII